MDAERFLDDLWGPQAPEKRRLRDGPVGLATVADVSDGTVAVVWDGEDTAAQRRYPMLASVQAGDRVVMLRTSGSSWVALGSIGVAEPEPEPLPPWRRAERTSNLTLATGTWTTVTITGGQAGARDITQAAGVFTIPKAGVYLLTAHAVFAANSSGNRLVRFTRNGTSENHSIAEHHESALSITTRLPLATQVEVNAGDAIRFQAYQSSGGNLALEAASITLHWQSPI